MSAKRSFQFIEDVTSDLTFVARGESLEDVFCASAEALLAATLESSQAVGEGIRRSLRLNDTDLDLLLARFLNELVFLRDAQGLVLRPVRIAIERDGEIRLRADLAGEELDPGRHGPGCDVKAVTMHGLRVVQGNDGWEASVTLDV